MWQAHGEQEHEKDLIPEEFVVILLILKTVMIVAGEGGAAQGEGTGEGPHLRLCRHCFDTTVPPLEVGQFVFFVIVQVKIVLYFVKIGT